MYTVCTSLTFLILQNTKEDIFKNFSTISYVVWTPLILQEIYTKTLPWFPWPDYPSFFSWLLDYCRNKLCYQQKLRILTYFTHRDNLEWMMHLYSALLCIAIHPKRFIIMWGVSPQPPPVCSIHLDDATAATGQRRQCAHHTQATGGEEREIEPIKWMRIIRRPW